MKKNLLPPGATLEPVPKYNLKRRPTSYQRKQITKRDNGSFDFRPDDSLKFKCKGQSYWLTEKECDARQKKPAIFPKCIKCQYAVGKENDPRSMLKGVLR